MVNERLRKLVKLTGKTEAQVLSEALNLSHWWRGRDGITPTPWLSSGTSSRGGKWKL